MASINPGEVLGRVLYNNRLRSLDPSGFIVGAPDPNVVNVYDWLAFTSVTGPYLLRMVNLDAQDMAGWETFAVLMEPSDTDTTFTVEFDYGGTELALDFVVPAGCAASIFDLGNEVPSTADQVDISTSAAVTIKQLYVGPALDFARGQWQGIKPGKLNTEVKRDITVAVNGSIIGTNVTRVTRQDQISLDYLPRDWVADEWLPFAKHAQRFPFFWQYAPTQDPESVTFSHARSVPDPELSSPSPLMKVSLPLVHEP